MGWAKLGLGVSVAVLGLVALGVACGSTQPTDEQPAPGPGPSCAIVSCAAQGYSCGQAPDGCGAVLTCGACPEGQTCGAGGMNVCGVGDCRPRSCLDQGRQCGPATDGCGKVIDCGPCTGSCLPRTCAQLGKSCGEVEDGCGGKLRCGSCGPGEACGAGGAANVCAAYQPIPCADQDLGTQLPVSLTGTVSASDRHRSSGCGLGDGGERILGWRAPADGTYVFDTTASSFDTVLYARRGDCAGGELACADGGISYGGASRLELTLRAGEPLALLVDTAAASGDATFNLHIVRKERTETAACTDWADNDGDGWVDCADPDCAAAAVCAEAACTDGRAPGVQPLHLASKVEGDTRGAGNHFVGSCGHLVTTREDRAFTFTAPRAGSFVFTVNGSAFAKALYVLTGCRGTELGCAVVPEGTAKTAALAVSLTAGQTVLVVVDEYDDPAGGPFALYVNERASTENYAEGTCGDGGDNDADGAADREDPDCR